MQGAGGASATSTARPAVTSGGHFPGKKGGRCEKEKVVQETSATVYHVACLRLISGSCEQKRSFRPGSLSSARHGNRAF